MHKRSKRNRPALRVRYSKEEIMKAPGDLEAQGLIYSKLCPDGEVRYFAIDASLKLQSGKKTLN